MRPSPTTGVWVPVTFAGCKQHHCYIVWPIEHHMPTPKPLWWHLRSVALPRRAAASLECTRSAAASRACNHTPTPMHNCKPRTRVKQPARQWRNSNMPSTKQTTLPTPQLPTRLNSKVTPVFQGRHTRIVIFQWAAPSMGRNPAQAGTELPHPVFTLDFPDGQSFKLASCLPHCPRQCRKNAQILPSTAQCKPRTVLP